MRMFVAALIGGALLGFIDAHLLAPHVSGLAADVHTQALLAAMVAAFLGSLWGWVAKGVFGSRAKD